MPGRDAELVLLVLGLREKAAYPLSAADTGVQGVLGGCGLGKPKPSPLEEVVSACVYRRLQSWQRQALRRRLL